MISGRLTLAQIDRTLQQARSTLQEVDEKVQHTTLQLARIRQQESKTYQKLATLRLDQIEDQTILSNLDQADERARQILTAREQALADLKQETSQSQGRQTELEEDRQRQNRLLEEAAQQLEHQLEVTHKRLQQSPEFTGQQATAQRLLDQAAAAEAKTAQANQDKEVKGLPYRNDKLFMYLWNRRYGTTDYRAWPLARLLDRWVAKHISFEQARRNYYMLTEIPKRLQAHAEQLQAQAGQAMEELSRLERAAELSDGVEPLEQAVADRQAKTEALDQAIADEEQSYAGLISRQEDFAGGRDNLFQQAIAVLVANFRSEPIPQLREEAEATYGYSDDSEVDRLAALRQEKTVLEDSLDEKRTLHRRRAAKVHQLEDLRRQFKQARYDAPNSRFSDGQMLEVMLGEFLRGLLSSDRLWRALRRSQRFIRTRSQPHPGTVKLPGGIRLPKDIRIPRSVRIPGGWGGGGRSRAPRMPKIRIPRGGGGGFRTGGGF